MACGGNDLVIGKVIGAPSDLFRNVRFRPDNTRWTLRGMFLDISTAGVACVTCGHLEVVVDVEGLRRMLGRKPEEGKK